MVVDGTCGCCEDGGYVVDGICVACGWGDVDHKALGDQLHAALSLLAECAALLAWHLEHMGLHSEEDDAQSRVTYALLVKLAEYPTVLAQAIERLEIACQEQNTDLPFYRDALANLRELSAKLDAATREEVE